MHPLVMKHLTQQAGRPANGHITAINPQNTNCGKTKKWPCGAQQAKSNTMIRKLKASANYNIKPHLLKVTLAKVVMVFLHLKILKFTVTVTFCTQIHIVNKTSIEA